MIRRESPRDASGRLAYPDQPDAGRALDLILVYRSNAVSNPENIEKYLDIVEMNLKEAVAIQPFAAAKDTQHPCLVRRLLEAILAPESQERFRKAGFHWIAERKAERKAP